MDKLIINRFDMIRNRALSSINLEISRHEFNLINRLETNDVRKMLISRLLDLNKFTELMAIHCQLIEDNDITLEGLK